MKKRIQILVPMFCFLPVVSDGIIMQATQSISSHYQEKDVVAVGRESYGTNAITGKACIVMKRKELKKICEGDIVIAPAIHSTWYSELSLAAAIITEKEDDSSHARAYGKKLNIPIIVGVENATKKIIDGQTITCDPIAKSIYHVSYPQHIHSFHLNKLPTAENGTIYPYMINGKSDVIHYSKLSHNTSNNSIAVVDQSVISSNQHNSDIIHNESEYTKKYITKDIYLSHFNKFKEFILSEKSSFGWTKWAGGLKAVEAGARKFGGCDDFAVECISVGESFFDTDEKHFVKTLYDIAQSAEYIDYINSLMNECSEKPGDLNWVARVSHKKHIQSIETPEEIKKEDLMQHPKEYRKIQHKVDRARREALIAAGLFVRYWVKKKLPL